MILGHLDHPETLLPLSGDAAWQEVFTWLNENRNLTKEGEYEIQGRDIYAMPQHIETLQRSEGVFEAHREYIDLHFCQEGGELIEWTPLHTLTDPKDDYDAASDVQLFTPPAAAPSVAMQPGMVMALYPEDAHMPKLSDGINNSVQKIVMKIKKAE